MIHVEEIKIWDFEIPENCNACPMYKSFSDSGISYNFCRLKKNKNWVDNTVKCSRTYYDENFYERCEFFRDKNCPLEDGKSYNI